MAAALTIDNLQLEMSAESSELRNLVREYFGALRSAPDFESACARMFDFCDADARIQPKEAPAVFQLGSYEVSVCFKKTFSQLSENLTLANKLEIYSAPRLLETIQFPNGHGALLSYMPGLDDAPLVEFESVPAELSSAALNRLLLDFELLLSAGRVHPYCGPKRSHWYVHPITQHVVLDRWEMMRRTANGLDGNVTDFIKHLSRSIEMQAAANLSRGV